MFGFACSSSTSFATTTPFALRHGPLPIRSRAFTAAFPSAPVVLRYARHVFPPAFASFASVWPRASAPVPPLRRARAARAPPRQFTQVPALAGICREKERHARVLRLRRAARRH